MTCHIWPTGLCLLSPGLFHCFKLLHNCSIRCLHLILHICSQWGAFLSFPVWAAREGENQQCRSPRFDPWVGKIIWRKEWQPIPVFLPGEFHGQRSLMGHSPWGRKELNTTEPLTLHYLASTDSKCSKHPWLVGRSLGYFSRNGIAGFHGLSLLLLWCIKPHFLIP